MKTVREKPVAAKSHVVSSAGRLDAVDRTKPAFDRSRSTMFDAVRTQQYLSPIGSGSLLDQDRYGCAPALDQREP
jgi:hypothetical protein